MFLFRLTKFVMRPFGILTVWTLTIIFDGSSSWMINLACLFVLCGWKMGLIGYVWFRGYGISAISLPSGFVGFLF